ncbi:NAD(+) diphosphatase [Tahibacter amnicola]|uniref:NAD(+) diphosphatase n=1 Tax=Tahibacter amnicola TaxID=2976241 RepID=A0ABY6BEB8_9GAMM|nr:NAD(+) diphosphatase [Tahibacter amnicola]UXI68094.1 NAD(+) diphosphatase [Tahibacter amnicola]
MTASLRSRANVFAALALERAADRRDDIGWISERRGHGSSRYVVIRSDGKALVQRDRQHLRYLADAERAQALADAPVTFLGETADAPYFVLAHPGGDEDAFAAQHDAAWLDLRAGGLALAAFEGGLFAYARALLFWHSRVRFCGACGSATTLVSAGHRALCSNPDCKLEHFPRTDPAIIVIVSYRDACLLGRQESWPAGRWSTLAGFVEPGETLEDAVRREVFEEAGVRVDESDYHSSQPWPFPASLMLGFTARASDPTIQVGPELAEARWFEVDDIVRGLADGTFFLPPPLSVSYRLLEHWLRETAGLDLARLQAAARQEPRPA